MNTTSDSFLIDCDDGNIYVVKFAGNPSEPDTLANEMLGAVLAKAAGLPVASGSDICITSSFLQECPDLLAVTWIRPGTHYGSRFIGETSGPGRPIQYLCFRDVDAVSNRSAFLGMYLFDVWANHHNSRKALFLRESNTRRLRSVFVSHGKLFRDPAASVKKDRLVARHWRTTLYSGLWQSEAVASWIRTFRSTLPQALGSTLPLIPSHWHSRHLDALQIALMTRLLNLPTLVEAHSLSNELCSGGTGLIDDELRARAS